MNTFEQDMAESYKKLENDMASVASLFSYKRKGYMGENIMLLDFNSQEFMQAQETISKYFTAIDNDNDIMPSVYKLVHVKGVAETSEFRLTTYPKNNRISFTF